MQENEINIPRDPEEEFIKVCGDGDIEQVKAMLRQAENEQDLLSARAYYGFREACRYNRINVVKYLLRVAANSEEILSARYYEGFGFACNEGSIEAAQYLFETYPAHAQQMIRGSSNNPFYWACSANQIEITKWLFEVAEDKQSLINSSYNFVQCAAFIGACTNGHKELAAWLLSVADNPQNLIRAEVSYYPPRPYYAFVSACESRQYEIVNFLMNSASDEDKQAMVALAQNNDQVKAVLKEFRSEISRVRLNSHIINQGLRTDSSLSKSPHCFFSTLPADVAMEITALAAENPPISYDEAKKLAKPIIDPYGHGHENESKETEETNDNYSWIKDFS